MTAVEWLVSELQKAEYIPKDSIIMDYVIQRSKEMEIEQSHKFAQFAVSCDRKNMSVLNFDDFIKL